MRVISLVENGASGRSKALKEGKQIRKGQKDALSGQENLPSVPLQLRQRCEVSGVRPCIWGSGWEATGRVRAWVRFGF